ncbi:MAG: class I SAM-dependent methyltransferase [Pseudomonadota bacterium]
MSIGEWILLSLSRTPGKADYDQGDSELKVDNALDLLSRVYPSFSSLVSGKRVVDYGCGIGYQSIALVKRYGCAVMGVDSNEKTLAIAVENAKAHNIPSDSLVFAECVSPEMLSGFDVVISQNSFEHFRDPEKALNEMGALLNSTGIVLLTFGPPWFSPYGSHMHFFCKVPWLNILFSERTVMNVRSRFREDGAIRYEDVESGLNKMTIAKFESIISLCGLRAQYKKYECVKGMNWLSRVPLLKELFVNNISVVLSHAA